MKKLLVVFLVTFTLLFTWMPFAFAEGSVHHNYYGGDSSSKATSSSKAIATGGKAVATGGSVGDITITTPPTQVNITVPETGKVESPRANVEGSPLVGDDGAFRQIPDTVQPTFPSLTQGGKDADWKVLNPDAFKWLPRLLTSDTIRKNKVKECKLSPKVIKERGWKSSHIGYLHEGKVYDQKTSEFRELRSEEYEVVGFITGSCPNGDTFDLHFRMAEAGMNMGGDALVYLQFGKGESPEAFSIGLFGGGVTSTLGGQSKDKSISVTGGLGINYGKAWMEEFPGLIAVVIELKDWSLVRK